MGESIQMVDLGIYRTTLALAVDTYEAELQGLPADPWERAVQRLKALPIDEGRAALIRNLKKKIPFLLRGPSAEYIAIVGRHFDALEALDESEQETLTSEEFCRRWQEYTSSLSEDERQIVEGEARRCEESFRSEIEKLSHEAEGAYLAVLVDAVERWIDRQQSSEGDALSVAWDRKLLELLRDALPDSGRGDGAADRREVMSIEWRGDKRELRELAGQLQGQGYIKSAQWFVERFGSARPPEVDGWGGPANLLVYLLEELQARKKFTHVPQSRLEAVFGIKGYKSKKDGYGRNSDGKPKKADEIDRILSSSSALPDS